ncbi:unnamed protein product [Thlaspi arvense]|uniref:Uncharacterized protein n=1 Tax=Thlaspi arvense TaxID=13288 RepID=A0AAU9RVA2_THLAR|nr:unnamed protein product [Thlaspi arvense]
MAGAGCLSLPKKTKAKAMKFALLNSKCEFSTVISFSPKGAALSAAKTISTVTAGIGFYALANVAELLPDQKEKSSLGGLKKRLASNVAKVVELRRDLDEQVILNKEKAKQDKQLKEDVEILILKDKEKDQLLKELFRYLRSLGLGGSAGYLAESRESNSWVFVVRKGEPTLLSFICYLFYLDMCCVG